MRLFRRVVKICAWLSLSEPFQSKVSASSISSSEENYQFEAGPLGTPNLTRVHQRRICARSLNAEEGEILTNPFTYIISPLTGTGQIIVNASSYYLSFSEPSKDSDETESMSNETPEKSIGEQASERATDEKASLNLPLKLGIPEALEEAVKKLGAGGSTDKPIIGAYYPDWDVNVLPPEEVQYSKYDLIYFAFAIPNEAAVLQFDQPDSLSTLDKLVKFAHGNGTRVILSIGGWGGSKYFSSVVNNQTAQLAFVTSVFDLLVAHNIDGVDIDWEYPGQAQIQDNIASPEDTDALLLFFQMLRARLGRGRIISAAVTDYTFVGKDGKRMKNVTSFGEVLDYILVMNYDVTGSSATPGPNAPFSNACHDSSQPGANMIEAIETWVQAGFPKKKILMGLPAYGYINWSSATSLAHKKRSIQLHGRNRFEMYSSGIRKRLSPRQQLCASLEQNCTSGQTPVDILTNTTVSQSASLDNSTNPTMELGKNRETQATNNGSGDLGSYSGPQIQFKDLFKWGVVEKNLSNPDGNLMGVNGYTLAWDECSSTPYAYNHDRNVVVTFDDANSTSIKATYALSSGIGGVGFWEITGDYNSILVDAVRKQFGSSA